MKTTITITAESEEGGTRYTINCVGDEPATEEMVLMFRNYWNEVDSHRTAEKSLPIMKQKREEMKQRVKDTAAHIKSFQAEGRLVESRSIIDCPF